MEWSSGDRHRSPREGDRPRSRTNADSSLDFATLRPATPMSLVAITPTSDERSASLPGDTLVTGPGLVTMDRAFTLPSPPAAVFPWLLQLGKRRAGWYLPHSIERFIPPARRGLRTLAPDFGELAVGEVIPDWGGRDATFTVSMLSPPSYLVHTSQRGQTSVSWCLALTPAGTGTRLHLRLRMAPVRRRWLGEYGGGIVDWVTVLGLAAGLRERLVTR